MRNTILQTKKIVSYFLPLLIDISSWTCSYSFTTFFTTQPCSGRWRWKGEAAKLARGEEGEENIKLCISSRFYGSGGRERGSGEAGGFIRSFLLPPPFLRTHLAFAFPGPFWVGDGCGEGVVVLRRSRAAQCARALQGNFMCLLPIL